MLEQRGEIGDWIGRVLSHNIPSIRGRIGHGQHTCNFTRSILQTDDDVKAFHGMILRLARTRGRFGETGRSSSAVVPLKDSRTSPNRFKAQHAAIQCPTCTVGTPFSMALTVGRETPILDANSSCDSPLAMRCPNQGRQADFG